MKYKYISRVKSKDAYTNGWQVKLPLIDNGKIERYSSARHTCFFSISTYKSVQGTLFSAIKYRDRYLTKNKALYLLNSDARIGSVYIKSPRNSSGVIGVALTTQVTVSGIYYAYKAVWTVRENGKTRQRSKEFSCLKMGECGAFKNACAYRYLNKSTIIIVNESNIPCLPDVPYKIIKEE